MDSVQIEIQDSTNSILGVLEVGNVKITLDNPLADLILKYRVGDTVNLKILHKEEEKNISVKLGEWE